MQTIPDFAQSKNISIPILNTWIYRHGLPIIKIGRRVYIESNDYNSWIADHKKIINQESSVKPMEISLPKQCRQSSIASKMRRIG
jgi:hypothetical protein